MSSWIVYEDSGLMVVNKPAGVLSQKDKSGDNDLAALIQEELKKNGQPLPFLAPVHRLDRNTSGLILLAKNPETARLLTNWIQEGKIHRSYLAIVKGDPGESGRYEFRLKKNERTNEVRVHESGEAAITEFTRWQKLGSSSLVSVRLLTGRSHQIRVHFSHAGHGLIGDKKYSKKPWSEIFARPALHAARIEVPAADGQKKRTWNAPIPPDFRALLVKLGGKPV